MSTDTTGKAVAVGQRGNCCSGLPPGMVSLEMEGPILTFLDSKYTLCTHNIMVLTCTLVNKLW